MTEKKIYDQEITQTDIFLLLFSVLSDDKNQHLTC